MFFVLLVLAMGEGLVLPVLPRLVEEFPATHLGSPSMIYGWAIACFGAGAFIFSPIMGRLADRFGRRPIVLLSLTGSVIDYLVAATATSLAVLLAARLLGGALSAGGAALQAAISDVSTPQERAKNFAVVGAAYGSGYVIGPAVGGLAGLRDPAHTFSLAAIFSVIALLLTLSAFPETLAPDQRRPMPIRALNPLMAVFAIRHLRLGSLLAVFAILNAGLAMSDPVAILFMKARLGWTTAAIGLFMSLGGVGIVLSRLLLTPYLSSALGSWRAILYGLASLIAYSLLFLMIDQSWQMYLAGGALLLGSIAVPLILAALSEGVRASDQGEFQGCLSSIHSLTGIVAPVLGTTAFAYFTANAAPIYLPGAPFLISGAAIVVAAFLHLRNRPTGSKSLSVPDEPAAGRSATLDIPQRIGIATDTDAGRGCHRRSG